MAGSNRKSYVYKQEHNYECIFENDQKYICAYCGMPAETMDHLLPISIMSNLSNSNIELISFKVPACSECNSLAGAVFFVSFKEKIFYIKNKLKIKYKKIYNMPKWEKEELLEYGPNAQQDIINYIKKQKILHERLDYVTPLLLKINDNFIPCKIYDKKSLINTKLQIFRFNSKIIIKNETKTIGEWCLYLNISRKELFNKIKKGYHFNEIFDLKKKRVLSSASYYSIKLSIENDDLVLACI